MIPDLEAKITRVLQEVPISAHALFETVIPVAAGLRTASIMYMDQLNFHMIRKSRKFDEETVPRMLKSMARNDFGIMMHEFPDPSIMIYGLPAEKSKRYVFFKDDSIGMEFHRMKAQYDSLGAAGEFGVVDTVKLSGLLRKEGQLLGVPQCCIEAYVADRARCHTTEMQDDTPEHRFRRQFTAEVPRLEEVKMMDRTRLAQFWAFEIYPCRLDCPEATSAGIRILDVLGERLGKVYEQAFMLNNAIRMHTPAQWNTVNMNRVSETKYDNWNDTALKMLGLRVRKF